jgi:hypothetical protein
VLQGRNRFLRAARSFQLFYESGDGERLELKILPEPARFSIHFPRYEVDETRSPDLQLFHWTDVAQRWVLVGGHGEAPGSTITADVKETGLFAAFTKGSEIEGEISVTGLQLTPNPFSPNGDGIHDFLNITYVLPEEIDQANVEIFDMRGERVRVLQFQKPGETVNRTTGLIWDGKDEDGRYVPLGIYICRVEVIGTQTKRWERATAAVAVVR